MVVQQQGVAQGQDAPQPLQDEEIREAEESLGERDTKRKHSDDPSIRKSKRRKLEKLTGWGEASIQLEDLPNIQEVLSLQQEELACLQEEFQHHMTEQTDTNGMLSRKETKQTNISEWAKPEIVMVCEEQADQCDAAGRDQAEQQSSPSSSKTQNTRQCHTITWPVARYVSTPIIDSFVPVVINEHLGITTTECQAEQESSGDRGSKDQAEQSHILSGGSRLDTTLAVPVKKRKAEVMVEAPDKKKKFVFNKRGKLKEDELWSCQGRIRTSSAG